MHPTHPSHIAKQPESIDPSPDRKDRPGRAKMTRALQMPDLARPIAIRAGTVAHPMPAGYASLLARLNRLNQETRPPGRGEADPLRQSGRSLAERQAMAPKNRDAAAEWTPSGPPPAAHARRGDDKCAYGPHPDAPSSPAPAGPPPSAATGPALPAAPHESQPADESQLVGHGDIVMLQMGADRKSIRAAFVEMQGRRAEAPDPEQAWETLEQADPTSDILLAERDAPVQGLFTRDLASCIAICLYDSQTGIVGMAHRPDTPVLEDSLAEARSDFTALTGAQDPTIVIAYGTSAYERDLREDADRDPETFIQEALESHIAAAGSRSPKAHAVQEALSALPPLADIPTRVDTVIGVVLNRHVAGIESVARRHKLQAVHLPHSCVLLDKQGRLHTFESLSGPPALRRVPEPGLD